MRLAARVRGGQQDAAGEPKKAGEDRCSFVEGAQACGRPTHCRGLCPRHYQRLRRHQEHSARVKKTCCWRNLDNSLCGQPVHGRDMCTLHYKRFLRRVGPSGSAAFCEPPPTSLAGKRKRGEDIMLDFWGQESTDSSCCGDDDGSEDSGGEGWGGAVAQVFPPVSDDEATRGFCSDEEDEPDPAKRMRRDEHAPLALYDGPSSRHKMEALSALSLEAVGRICSTARGRQLLDAEWFVNQQWLQEVACNCKLVKK